MLEFIGWFMIGAGLSMLIIGLYFLCYTIIRPRNRKLIAFIEKLKSEADLIKDKIENNHKAVREVSELVFHDKEGNWNTVRIIIDHSLDDLAVSDKEELKDMILKGESGGMVDLVSGDNLSDGNMNKIQEFIFSPQAIRDMRLAGIEPDEIVTRMLKASGRME